MRNDAKTVNVWVCVGESQFIYHPKSRLVPNFKDKETYVIHIKHLNQILKHGFKLKKVHQVIRFEQSYWMQAHDMLSIKLRTAANNEFEEDLFKLINNSVLEKTMKNIRNHRDKPRETCQVCDKAKV